jgi:hypothetical protein
MKPLIMQFPPISRHFIPPRSKHFLQHPSNSLSLCSSLDVRDHEKYDQKSNSCTLLVRKPQGKRPLDRAIRRRVDSIKIDLRELGWDGMRGWIDLAQDRDQWKALVNKVSNLRVP